MSTENIPGRRPGGRCHYVVFFATPLRGSLTLLKQSFWLWTVRNRGKTLATHKAKDCPVGSFFGTVLRICNPHSWKNPTSFLGLRRCKRIRPCREALSTCLRVVPAELLRRRRSDSALAWPPHRSYSLLHKNTSTPSLARHHTQCEPVHGITFQPELHHKMLSTSPVSNSALGPMDASGSCRGHGDNHHHHKLSCTTCTGGMDRCYHGLRAHVSSLPGTRKHALESKNFDTVRRTC